MLGTGGQGGWPQPGCRCASCGRARSAGGERGRGRVVVNGTLEIRAGQRPGSAESPAPQGTAASAAAHQVQPVPGGWDITAPDGGKLIIAAGPGAVPQPPDDRRYDVALLDLLERPEQLGELRGRGLVSERTAVAALCADHRVTSPGELARRCRIWRVAMPEDGLILTGPAAPGDAVLPAGPTPAPPGRVLVIGGARSGKSREAQLRLAGEPRVTYLAAGPWVPGSPGSETDGEWAWRVAAHRAARPTWWQTVESIDLAGALRDESGALLIDGIGTWLAAVLQESGAWSQNQQAAITTQAPPRPAREIVAGRVAELVEAWRQTTRHVVAVTDQVGSGIVPATPAGRIFRDELGWLNQLLAAESEETVLVVAGRPWALPP